MSVWQHGKQSAMSGMGEAELGWYGVMCAERAAIGAFLVVLEYT